MDFSNCHIAELLNISEATVHRHLARIRKKFGIHKSNQIMNYRDTTGKGGNMIKLTPRGKEVFKLCLDGHSTKEISTMLKIGISGVRRHKEKMLLDNKCESMRQLFSLYYISNKLNILENNTM